MERTQIGRIVLLLVLMVGVAVYPTLYILSQKNKERQQIATDKYTAEITKASSQVLHDIRRERRQAELYTLDTDHVVQRGRAFHHHVTETDKGLLHLITLLRGTSLTHADVQALLMRDAVRTTIQTLDNLLVGIGAVRSSILSRDLSLDGSYDYYTRVNDTLLKLVQMFTHALQGVSRNDIDLYLFERIKASLSREVFYLDKQLFTPLHYLPDLRKIRAEISRQERWVDVYLSRLSPTSRYYMWSKYLLQTHKNLSRYEAECFAYHLNTVPREQWLKHSHNLLDQLQALTHVTFETYYRALDARYDRMGTTVYLFDGLGVLFIVFALFLGARLYRTFQREEHLLEEAHIASYAFETQEAMAILDAHQSILRGNHAFERLTGYSFEEVAHKPPSFFVPNSLMLHDQFEEIHETLKREGRWKGEVEAEKKNGEHYIILLSVTAIRNADQTVEKYVVQFTDITELKKARDLIVRQATYDFLTQIPNRQSMLDRLEEERVRAEKAQVFSAFFFVDLDHFKKINDTYGHATGDEVLIEASRRLAASVRTGDVVARLSGDEFGVMLIELGTTREAAEAEAQKVAEGMLSTLGAPMVSSQGTTIHIGGSVGIRIFPDHTSHVSEIIQQADAAMYEAKSNGKNQYRLFDHVLEKRMQEQIALQEDVGRALEAGEMVFYYQPKVSLKRGEIVGAEMLMRWEHPLRGLLYPECFFDALQHASLLPTVTKMTIETACRFLEEHAEVFGGTLGINVTVHDLRSPTFVSWVETMLQRHAIAPSQLEFEILEHDLIEDFDAVIGHMERLSHLGIRFAIDDFGTGYSSINYLYRLPVETLKIDRSFVDDHESKKNKELLKIIVNFAKIFKMKTVIEGLESEASTEMARALGIDYYQGFYFSEALDAPTFCAKLTESLG